MRLIIFIFISFYSFFLNSWNELKIHPAHVQLNSNHIFENSIFLSHDRIAEIKQLMHNRSQGHQCTYTDLLENPKACANWHEIDYWNACLYLFAHAYSNDYPGPIPSGMKPLLSTNTHQFYIRKSDLLAILKQWQLYDYPAFWDFIRKLPDYQTWIEELYRTNNAQLSHCARNRMCKELSAYQEELIKQVQRSKEAQRQKKIQETFFAQAQNIEELIGEYQELLDLYNDYTFGDPERLEKRLDALCQIKNGNVQYSTRSYMISHNAKAGLRKIAVADNFYETFYGNQLQHVLYKECIDLLDKTIALSVTSPIHAYQHALIHWTDAARIYNHGGYANDASHLADVCWSLLDFGKAILEGAGYGIIYAAHDIAQHPFETTFALIAGEYLLAFHLGKVVFNLARIGLDYAIDPEQGKEEWNAYIEPLHKFYDAIQKGEITSRDCIKCASQFGVQLVAQRKMFKGLSNFCNATKTKTLEYISSYPSTKPQQYMATPEGRIFKIIHKFYNFEEPINVKFPKKQEFNKLINALRNFNGKKFAFDNNTFILDKTGLKHILERHHPNFWNGTLKLKQSFFHKNLTIDEIIEHIGDIMRQNREILIKNGTNTTFQIKGFVENKIYVVGINKGRIGQFYFEN